jgi:hypothetical protein
MSVTSLSNTKLNVYSVTPVQNSYGANSETYTLKYSAIPARVRYLNGMEDLVGGKFQTLSIYRIYVGKMLNIIATDLICDYKNRKYDILYVNRLDRRRFLQIDAKLISSMTGDVLILSIP